MKHLKIGTIGMLFIAMLFSVNTFAQRGNGYGNGNGYGQGYFCNNIPNLTTDQQTKITNLRTGHWKQMQASRNQLAVKNANLQTLRSSGDINAINKTIDEMSVIRTNMQKNREQHFQDVRSILNADQQVYFDNFNSRRGNGRGYGRGNGRGYGRGNGRGRCGGRGW
ncbi:MAG: Spy/CpxP family protein refolding chaperone [Bacteroidota bacterium]|nr:Spy/CpxP family protein refolding chaperone [Bacteroidota bacterium]